MLENKCGIMQQLLDRIISKSGENTHRLDGYNETQTALETPGNALNPL